ncbi:MAG: DUF393 domain-containing protein [Bacteroidales bacterium]|nr:DUF393 domain-containing protein [Bacteroidales bacterium]
MNKNRKSLIFVDGECALCSWWGKFILKRDYKNRFIVLANQSDKAIEILKSFDYLYNRPDSIVLIEKNKIYFKSAAVLRIVRHLRGVWPVLWILIIIPRVLRDFFYDKIAINRHMLFGQQHHCNISEF